MKPEFLLSSSAMPIKTSLEADGRTRGMNKGADRLHSTPVSGTERPPCDGEQNFFAGETLRRVKEALRAGKQQKSPSPRLLFASTNPPPPPTTTAGTTAAAGNANSASLPPPPPPTTGTTAPLSLLSDHTKKRERVEEEEDTDEQKRKRILPAAPPVLVSPTMGAVDVSSSLSSSSSSLLVSTESAFPPVVAAHSTSLPPQVPSLVDNTKHSSSSIQTGMLGYLPPPEPPAFSVLSWEAQQADQLAVGGEGNAVLVPPQHPSGRAPQSGAQCRERVGRGAEEEEEEVGGGLFPIPLSHSRSRRGVLSWLSSGSGVNAVPPLVLAPLTTVGNLPFRRICKEFGADVTMSEMAVVYNLHRTQKSEWSLLRRHQAENIFGLQLAVSNPIEAKNVAMALEASGFQYDFIDINGGCPIDAINGRGCGCALLERTRNATLPKVIDALASHQTRPVTLKCRTGADEQCPTLHTRIPTYCTYPLAALTIHGRSRRQRYTKAADWKYIERCAALASGGCSLPLREASAKAVRETHEEEEDVMGEYGLPVIGNGDILSWEDVATHRAECPHVSAYMIGRGALIKPWIFKEIRSERVLDISSTERFDMLKKFCGYGLSHWGSDTRGVMTTRRFLCEWLSFLYRYVPAGVLECLPQRMNDRPPSYQGRDEVETMMTSASVVDWISLSELLLGPVEPGFRFTPKHKSNSFTHTPSSVAGERSGGVPQEIEGGMDEENANG